MLARENNFPNSSTYLNSLFIVLNVLSVVVECFYIVFVHCIIFIFTTTKYEIHVKDNVANRFVMAICIPGDADMPPVSPFHAGLEKDIWH